MYKPGEGSKAWGGGKATAKGGGKATAKGGGKATAKGRLYYERAWQVVSWS